MAININLNAASKSAPKSALKRFHTIEDILNEFETLDQVQFDLFKPDVTNSINRGMSRARSGQQPVQLAVLNTRI
jgi:hypothetical protein